MRYSTIATVLVRQADGSLLGVGISSFYTFSGGEAKYIQAIADAHDKRPEEILDSMIRFGEGGDPYLINWSGSIKASSTIMSAALSMFLHEPSPVDPPPFHDPKPRNDGLLAGTVPNSLGAWKRAAERWRKYLNSGDGERYLQSCRAAAAFDKALRAALKFDGKACRASVIEAAKNAGYMCDCCERLIRQGLRYDGIYTCCHECAQCQSLEHYPCCHGVCDQPTVTQFNTLTAAMLRGLIRHANSEKLDVYRLTAAMAMVTEYDEVTVDQRNKAKRELFTTIHKLQVRPGDPE